MVVTAASVVLFAYSFLRTATVDTGSCSGSDCLQGDMRWAVLLAASVVAFVAGFLLISFGGRGYGRTTGPGSFGEVDSGNFAPGQRERSGDAPRPLRWSRTWRNVYLRTGAGEFGLALLFGIVAIGHPAVRSGFVTTAVILGGVGTILFALGWRAAQNDRLHDTGLDGEATILGVEQTGIWMNNNAYIRLDLAVSVAGHPPYEVKHGEIVPQVAIGRLTSGAPLPVKVDPDRPSHLLVEWERL